MLDEAGLVVLINMEAFMNDSEWQSSEKFVDRVEILPWSEVEELKRYMVLSIQIKQLPGKSFKSYIMTYCDQDEQFFKVWCPSHFVKQIRKNRQTNFRPYFVSHGHHENGNSKTANFEISYKPVEKNWDIFTEEEYEI